MKRQIIATIITSFLASTAAYAQPFHGPRHAPAQRYSPDKVITKQKTIVKDRQHWRRGAYLPPHYRHRTVDYRRHHLAPPPRGRAWVQVDNQYLLISMATGLIAGLATAR